MADTIGTKEASEEWGYPQSTIRRWCLKGLIPFATQDAPGSPWHIPKSAKCPRPIKNKKALCLRLIYSVMRTEMNLL